MNEMLKVTRFQLRDTRNSLVVFYAIFAGVLLLFSYLSGYGNGRLSGLGLAAGIFIFIAGLNCFSTAFRFMQANNVSRRRFFAATSTALVLIAALMAAVDAALNAGLSRLFFYEGLFQQLYPPHSLLVDFCWSFALFTFVAFLGWLITMIYYRSNAWVRIVVSISPVFVIILLSYLNQRSGWVLVSRLIEWVGWALGLAGTTNPFAAVLTFLSSGGLAAAGTWMLLRRAVIHS